MNRDRLYHRDLAWGWTWGPTKLEKTLAKRQITSHLYCYGSGYGDEDNTCCTSPIMRTMVKLRAKYEQLLQHNSSAVLMFRPIHLLVDMTNQFRLPVTLTSLKIAAEVCSACMLRIDHILAGRPLLSEVIHVGKPNVQAIDGS